MRPLLESPPFDVELLAKVEALTDELYALHQRGRSETKTLAQLNALIVSPVDEMDVDGAFGSIRSEAWARFLAFDWSLVPDDLSREEMLEVIQRVRGEETNEFLLDFWIECLKKNTGNPHFGDLLYWPNVYFGDEEKLHVELTAEELLETALTTKIVARASE